MLLQSCYMAMEYIESGSPSCDLLGEHGINHMTWPSFRLLTLPCLLITEVVSQEADSQAYFTGQRIVSGKQLPKTNQSTIVFVLTGKCEVWLVGVTAHNNPFHFIIKYFEEDV